MTSTIELQTPAEIDTELAKLYNEIARQDAIVANCERRARDTSSADLADQLRAHADVAARTAEALREQASPLQDEWVRRGCWTRFYLVTNSNGHVHHTISCVTTYDGTSFAWLTQFSGTSHEDLVELAGEKACTVCFPNAPVDVLKRPSKLTTPEREAREAEKAAKAAEKAKNEIVVEGLIDFGRLQRAKTFKSARAVTNLIASELSSMCWYGPTHPSFKDWEGNVVVLRKALEAKGIEYDYDKTLANARKRVVKDGGEAKY